MNVKVITGPFRSFATDMNSWYLSIDDDTYYYINYSSNKTTTLSGASITFSKSLNVILLLDLNDPGRTIRRFQQLQLLK